MIELFLGLSERSVGAMHAGQWNTIQKGLQRNVEKTRLYYQNFPQSVRSDHFLIRILQKINAPLAAPLEKYYDHVDAISSGLSQSLGMASSSSRGRLFRGDFYGGHTPEIFLHVDDYFDFEEADANWEDIQAVTPLLHAKSDLDMLLPNGQVSSSEEGLTVIQIHIAKLAVQWRAFKRDQLHKGEGDSPQSINMFIGGYVLPNMIPAHMELCLFNRMYNLLTGEGGDSAVLRKHAFSLPRYDFVVDSILDKSLEYVSKSPKEFEGILKSLPALNYPSMYQALKMPDMAATRQVDWILVAARLKMIDFLCQACGTEVFTKNQFHINQVLRSLRHNDVQRLIFSQDADIQRELTNYAQLLLGADDPNFL